MFFVCFRKEKRNTATKFCFDFNVAFSVRIIFSGTRGVWVGIVVPVVFLDTFTLSTMAESCLTSCFADFNIFHLSCSFPIYSKGLIVLVRMQAQTLQMAGSIYDWGIFKCRTIADLEYT